MEFQAVNNVVLGICRVRISSDKCTDDWKTGSESR